MRLYPAWRARKRLQRGQDVADGPQQRSEDKPPREGGHTGAGENAGGGDDDDTATGNPHAADG